MSWKSPIPTRSLLLLSFLLVLSGPALEGCQSASVGDTSGAKPPEAAEEHESNRIYKNAGKVCCIQTIPETAKQESIVVLEMMNGEDVDRGI